MPNTPVDAAPKVWNSAAQKPREISGEQELTHSLQRALSPSFVLVRRIGAGGMGIVYLARDPALKRHVAVKVMSPEHALNPETRARFQREAESVASISHPNVVAVYSVGTLENGLPYLVMQYIDGPTLADRIAQEGPLDLAGAKQIIGQVAAGLDAAHRKGIVHRDIKAANVLWDEGTGRALVTDFGIAAVTDTDFHGETLRLTQTGLAVGTPQYMSPEQLLSERITEKADIYSLGLLGYELLTGEGPYQTVSSPAAMMTAHLRDQPRALTALRPDADPPLESLLTACLDKDPESRPSAEEVARRLQHGSTQLLEWPPPGLEDLQGAAPKVINQLFWGSLAMAAPAAIVATTDPSAGIRFSWPLSLSYPAIAAGGAVATAVALGHSLRLFRMALRAAKAGYGWGTIAEVMVDSERDTGAVIVGEREYSSLTLAQRNDVRQWRLAKWGFRAVGGAWALGAMIIGIPVAARLGSTTLLALWMVLLPLMGLIASEVAAMREHVLMKPIRAKLRTHRGPLERLSNLASTWNDSFERVVQGVARGAGKAGGLARRSLGVAAMTLAIGVGAVTTFGFLGMSVAGDYASTIGLRRFGFAGSEARNARRLAAWRAPVDPSITPLEAGQILHAIELAGGRKRPGFLPAAFAMPAIPSVPQALPGFGGYWNNGTMIRAAKRGLTPEQRKFVEELAAMPGEKEFSRLGRAAFADWLSASLKPDMSDVPVIAVGLRANGNLYPLRAAHTARAALALEAGKLAEAERYLREIIGAGAAMLDSPDFNVSFEGSTLINAGRAELLALYEVTGRPAEAARIGQAGDVEDQASYIDVEDGDRLSQLEAAKKIIDDPRRRPAVRWAIAVRYLAYQPCGDLRQMLFGPSAEHLANLAAARAALVRTPSDEVLMRMAENALDTPDERGLAGAPRLVGLVPFARTMDALTGSKRMTTCASLMVF